MPMTQKTTLKFRTVESLLANIAQFVQTSPIETTKSQLQNRSAVWFPTKEAALMLLTRYSIISCVTYY